MASPLNTPVTVPYEELSLNDRISCLHQIFTRLLNASTLDHQKHELLKQKLNRAYATNDQLIWSVHDTELCIQTSISRQAQLRDDVLQRAGLEKSFEYYVQELEFKDGQIQSLTSQLSAKDKELQAVLELSVSQLHAVIDSGRHRADTALQRIRDYVRDEFAAADQTNGDRQQQQVDGRHSTIREIGDRVKTLAQQTLARSEKLKRYTRNLERFEQTRKHLSKALSELACVSADTDDEVSEDFSTAVSTKTQVSENPQTPQATLRRGRGNSGSNSDNGDHVLSNDSTNYPRFSRSDTNHNSSRSSSNSSGTLVRHNDFGVQTEALQFPLGDNASSTGQTQSQTNSAPVIVNAPVHTTTVPGPAFEANANEGTPTSGDTAHSSSCRNVVTQTTPHSGNDISQPVSVAAIDAEQIQCALASYSNDMRFADLARSPVPYRGPSSTYNLAAGSRKSPPGWPPMKFNTNNYPMQSQSALYNSQRVVSNKFEEQQQQQQQRQQQQRHRSN